MIYCTAYNLLKSTLVYGSGEPWHRDLFRLLQAASALDSFHINCDSIPASIWRALPSSLRYLGLEGAIDNYYHPPVPLLNLDDLSWFLTQTDGLPNLVNLTYEPNIAQMMEEIEEVLVNINQSNNLEEMMSQADTYAARLESLGSACRQRGVSWTCSLTEYIAGAMADLHEEMELREEEAHSGSDVLSDSPSN